MLFVLCYPKLSAADRQALEAFRLKHEPARAQMVRAHVTLVFGVKSASVGALTDLAAALGATTAPFDFAIEGLEVEAHERGDHNLLLRIGVGGDALVRLNAAFYAGVLAPERGDIAFVPHMTIATNADLKAVITAAREAKPLTSIKGRIDTLDIAALDGTTLTSIEAVALTG